MIFKILVLGMSAAFAGHNDCAGNNSCTVNPGEGNHGVYVDPVERLPECTSKMTHFARPLRLNDGRLVYATRDAIFVCKVTKVSDY